MKLNFYGSSDTGRVRLANQDNFTAERLCSNSALCVVCDGMGGARGGNVASQLAAEIFSERIRKLAASKTSVGRLRLTPESACRMLDDALQTANSAVYKKSLESEEYRGMGTTLVAVLFCGSIAYAINVGDSRLYLVADGELTQITHDHSYVQHLVDSGQLTEEEARRHPFRNRITRAVGISQSIEPDIFSIELAGIEDCCLLLCSDGLHGLLGSQEIHDIICGDQPIPDSEIDDELKNRVDHLIEAANSAGGSDNITAVLIKYADDER